MASQLYEMLSSIGYHHPLHPALAHLPVGLTIGGFIFIFLAYVLKRPNYARTAKHCAALALLASIPTMIVGYLDWQHFYGGSFMFPIKMKLVLAATLPILLTVAVAGGKRSENRFASRLLMLFLSLLVVSGIGYFGGELVYGKKTIASSKAGPLVAATESVVAGGKIFESKCSFCHVTDSTDTKVGPGLKGLFQREKMPVSGWPVSPESVRRQLKTPFDEMPPFESLDSGEIKALTEFLKAL